MCHSSLTFDVTCNATTLFSSSAVQLKLFTSLNTFSELLVFVGKMGMLELDRATLMISTTLSIGLGIAIGWALRGRTSAAKALKKAFWEDVSFYKISE